MTSSSALFVRAQISALRFRPTYTAAIERRGKLRHTLKLLGVRATNARKRQMHFATRISMCELAVHFSSGACRVRARARDCVPFCVAHSGRPPTLMCVVLCATTARCCRTGALHVFTALRAWAWRVARARDSRLPSAIQPACARLRQPLNRVFIRTHLI